MEAALDISREELAHKAHARACELAHRLELQARQTFAHMVEAQTMMRECGVTAEIELSPGLAAAFMDYKVQECKPQT